MKVAKYESKRKSHNLLLQWSWGKALLDKSLKTWRSRSNRGSRNNSRLQNGVSRWGEEWTLSMIRVLIPPLPSQVACPSPSPSALFSRSTFNYFIFIQSPNAARYWETTGAVRSGSGEKKIELGVICKLWYLTPSLCTVFSAASYTHWTGWIGGATWGP